MTDCSMLRAYLTQSVLILTRLTSIVRYIESYT